MRRWPLRLFSFGIVVFGLAYSALILFGRYQVGFRLPLYYPTVVSAVLLITFGRTLFGPQSMVERFARLQKSQLNEAEVAYCRSVTQVWCVFFVMNGSLALGLALTDSLKAWAFYTGFLSYLLIGLLFAAEFLYRQWRFGPSRP